MKKFKLLVLGLFMSTMAFPQQSTLNLMPYPESLVQSNGKFRLTKDFTITVLGNQEQRLYDYASRVLRRLSNKTALFVQQDYITKSSENVSASLVINSERKGLLKVNEDESYSLIVTEKGIKLDSKTDFGAMRGLETLLQLITKDNNGYFIPTLEIKDRPRFVWRGLMIDACRHFMPIEIIKRNIDAMAAVKMNVFHWHLSEDQGVRVESKVFPQIAQLCSDGLFYTQEEIRQVIKYAGDRGIRVYPEFDVPGHSTAWFMAFPELSSGPKPEKIERNWGVLDPTFDPTNEKTYKFFEKFFAEMAALFPDEYFHIGGDENNGKQWKNNPKIQEFMKKKGIEDNHALQAYFNKRILTILTKNNKKMVGWDEILHPEMPNNIVIQSWRGVKSLNESAKKGYQSLLSNGYYIDLIQPAKYHYQNDPLPNDTALSLEQSKMILGGEATMWSELVTPENVDSRVWPRTAAIAERFWSPRNVNDVSDMYRRLDFVSLQLEELGLAHISFQDMMLRRMSGNFENNSLKTFLTAVEPVKIYTRHRQGVKYTSYSPYTRFVDAAFPESNKAREFNNNVAKFIQTQNYNLIPELVSQLKTWKNNREEIKNIIVANSNMKDADSLSINISRLASIGMEMLTNVNSKTAILNNIAVYEKTLTEAKKPYAQMEIAFIEGIKNLIEFLKK